MKCPKCHRENPESIKFCGECGTQLISQLGGQPSFTKTLETPSEELTRGVLFAGRYEIIEELGVGGMGQVFRVEDKKTKEEIALKLIKPEISNDKKSIERFRSELTLARKIRHKNVCGMFDLGEENRIYYITMEYIPGEDLRSFIKRSKLLSIPSALSIGIQLTQGLAEAHRLGVIHRDLKPSNIMIDKEGNARIMDFGIARLQESERVTGDRVIIGTPSYMSPEQAEAKEIDPRTDIYSIGVILFEMLTGRLPFEGNTPLSVAVKQKMESPPDPKTFNPDIPDELSRIILMCLEKNKEMRFQTTEALVSALENLKDYLPTVEKKKAGIKTSVSGEVTVTFNPKRILIPFFLLAAVVIVSIFVFQLIKNRPEVSSLKMSLNNLTFSGKAYFPAISPDGKSFAFVEDGKIFLRSIDSDQVQEIYEGIRVGNLRWLRDGNNLSFQDALNGERGPTYTYVISRFGGESRSIARTGFVTWSPDGTKYAYLSGPKTITITDSDTGFRTQLPLNENVGWFRGIEWSPCGKFILYLDAERESRICNIWIVTADGKHQNKVYHANVNAMYAQWAPKGPAAYIVQDTPDGSGIWKLHVSEDTGEAIKPPSLLTSGLFGYFTVAEDGRRLLFQKSLNYSNLHIATFNGSGDKQEVAFKQLTTGTAIHRTPRISPDNSRVVFSKSDTLGNNIYIMPLEGGPIHQITFMKAINLAPSWSPDGENIAFGSTSSETSAIWMVDAKGGNPRRISKSAASNSLYNIWAPGSNVLFQNPGNRNYTILNPETGDETILIKNEYEGHLFFPQYSPDAKNMVFDWNRPSNEGLYIISLENNTQTRISNERTVPIGWTADSSWIYALRTSPLGEVIKIRSDGEGDPEFLFKLPDRSDYLITMTSDGKKFVFPIMEYKSDILLLENFDPEIK